jgi:t-SNARE complex subunit (syntaxin)
MNFFPTKKNHATNVTIVLFLLSHTTAFFSSDPSGGGKSWTAGTSGVAMTGNQQLALQQIRDRDAEFDQDLDEIGEGIQDLHELALRQGEEVKRQNQMLNEVGSKIDNAHEHMVNVNAKMKDTLNEVGRSSDKLCVDIMCIVLGIGLAAVIYKMATGGGSF